MALRTFTPSGGKIFDSTDPCFGVCIGIVKAQAAPQSVSYPALAGSTIKALSCNGRSVTSAVSYPGGIPTVTLPAYTFSSAAAPLVVSVWASTKQAVSPGPGITAVNEGGGSLALSPQGFGLYYESTLATNGTYVSGAIEADGFRPLDAWHFQYPWGFSGSQLDRVFVLELEENISSRMDIEPWGVVVRSRYSNTGNPYPPKVHMFRRAAAPVGPPFFNMKTDAGELTWDLMRVGMLKAAGEGTNTPTLPQLKQVAGVSHIGVIGAMPADKSVPRTEQVPTGNRIIEYEDGVPYDRGSEMKDITTCYGEVHYLSATGPLTGGAYVYGLQSNRRTYRGDPGNSAAYSRNFFFVNLDFLYP